MLLMRGCDFRRRHRFNHCAGHWLETHRVVAGRSRESVRGGVRRGLTLVELLVAVTLTLLVVLAVVQAFQILGDSMQQQRAMLELSGQLRTVAQRLQEDLDSITCPLQPPIDPSAGLGYFEYIEGRRADLDSLAGVTDGNADGVADPQGGTTNVQPQSYYGDFDDCLMFTVRSRGKPFRGYYTPTPGGASVVVESNEAEIVWWVGWKDTPDATGNDNVDIWDLHENLVVYRRVLLIRPDLTAAISAYPCTSLTLVNQFFTENDLSARPNLAAGHMEANSLSDLTDRKNRYAHWPIPPNSATNPTNPGWLIFSARNPKAGVYEGSDIVLGDVLAFDVRAFDPDAPLVQLTADPASPVLRPGDIGFALPPSSASLGAVFQTSAGVEYQLVGRGAFVDLGYSWNYPRPNFNSVGVAALKPISANAVPLYAFNSAAGNPASRFATRPHYKSRLHKLLASPSGDYADTYDTWSTGYERDGINQDPDPIPVTYPQPTGVGDLVIDEGTNGLDDDGAGGVDDINEQETSPPYPYPLRGIEVTVRMLEFGTRQVRQVSVVGDFVPE
ncbi:MAG: hypothetical protein R3E01_26535 [Pirellulaceae bacterium]|nr:hypothetical protein [Planctomycetales bacterium]